MECWLQITLVSMNHIHRITTASIHDDGGILASCDDLMSRWSSFWLDDDNLNWWQCCDNVLTPRSHWPLSGSGNNKKYWTQQPDKPIVYSLRKPARISICLVSPSNLCSSEEWMNLTGHEKSNWFCIDLDKKFKLNCLKIFEGMVLVLLVIISLCPRSQVSTLLSLMTF